MSMTRPSRTGEAPADAPRDTHPRVSIGLPAYNGERYLRQALDSVLAQTYSDFEVVISDNASTDETARICRDYLERDPRIRYHRNDVNIGGDRNYNRCVELSRGQYFLGLAHDDVLAPDYVRRCVDVLDRDASIVFCHTRANEIDGEGDIAGTFPTHEFSESPRAHERFFDATCLVNGVVATVGMTRMTTLRQIAPLVPFAASDAFRQAELALRGRLFEVPEYLFFRRVYPESGSQIPLHQRIAWSDPSRANAITFPTWRRLGEYARAILRTPLPPVERLRCFAEIGRFIQHRRWLPRLKRDLQKAGGILLRRSDWGRRYLENRKKRPAGDGESP
jgi:glycosyltransferase involved in cell wall biosynthesis